VRLPGVSRLGPVPASRRSILAPLLVAAVVAAGGAATAIALTRDSATATPILTATGGSELVRTPTVAATALAEWPAGRSAWTNVLVSIPKVQGRDAALARAEQARRRGLRQVGVLDSSRYASLHPGYWVVFSGIYPSEAEAASRLREAKGVQRGARTARISR
jgi:hypothetical protein